MDTGHDNQLGLVFSPDGQRAYWVAWNGKWGGAGSRKTIYESIFIAGQWSEPRSAPFSGEYSDDDPFVSPDGHWLYFVSDRPANDADTSSDADVWRYRLSGGPRLERLSVNSATEEYSPVVTNAGDLYFASARAGGVGQGDLYMAEAADGGFAAPELLGPALNSTTGEWNLWVSPAADEILFEASSRSTNLSESGDIYYSRRSSEGWSAAVPVAALNTAASDLMPRMQPCSNKVFFTRAVFGDHASVRSADWEAIRAGLRSEAID